MPRGPKFDSIVDQVFAIQLTGRGKTPEEREKILRKLSGIKEAPKKKEKKGKGNEKAHAALTRHAEAPATAKGGKPAAREAAANSAARPATKHAPKTSA